MVGIAEQARNRNELDQPHACICLWKRLLVELHRGIGWHVHETQIGPSEDKDQEREERHLSQEETRMNREHLAPVLAVQRPEVQALVDPPHLLPGKPGLGGGTLVLFGVSGRCHRVSPIRSNFAAESASGLDSAVGVDGDRKGRQRPSRRSRDHGGIVRGIEGAGMAGAEDQSLGAQRRQNGTPKVGADRAVGDDAGGIGS